MTYFLLGVGFNHNNKPSELIIGSMPWQGIQKVNILELALYKEKIKNLEMTDHFDLVGTCGDIHRYTSYNVDTNKFIKKSLVILAQSTSYKGKIYFVTDGINNPVWLSTYEISSEIQRKGYGLANGKLGLTSNEIEFIGKAFEYVDLRQNQLEYKRFIKGQEKRKVK